MKIAVKIILTAISSLAAVSCSQKKNGNVADDGFNYTIDQFADLKIMRYKVPGWDALSLKQKEYAYHLSEAAKYGRDITWDQYCRYNLPLRHILENIIENYNGDRENDDFKDFIVYAKRVFFSNGVHHHYAEDKFFPDCPKDYFKSLMSAVGYADQELLDFPRSGKRKTLFGTGVGFLLCHLFKLLIVNNIINP